MSIFPESNLVYPPKVGESVEVTITGQIKRVQNEGGEGNYKTKNKDFGYYDLLPVNGDSEMKMNTWKLYFALKDLNPDEGDTIKIEHPASGEYKLTKV